MDNNILKILSNSKGYEIALFSSYTFEIVFFEQYVLKTMSSIGIKKISVFADSKQFNKAVACAGSALNAGSKYPVNLIEMKDKKAFHPKVILLLGKNRARVFVSSCNLTSAGYLIQNEVFYYYDFDENNRNNKELVLGAIDFFCKLNELSHYQDDLFNLVKKFRADYEVIPGSSDGPVFIHNLEESMIEQISKNINETEQIEIAVPYYDDECEAVKTLSRIYKQPEITLFLENEHARIQVNKLDNLTNVKLFPFSSINERKKTFYHGKVFKFINGEESYVFFGSANCTRSALVLSYKNGGNIEADVIHKINADESISFYDCFQKCKDSIQYDTSKPDTESECNFFFRHGELTDKICLYFGYYLKPENLVISLNGDQCKYYYNGNNVVVVFDDNGDIVDNTIILEFNFDGKTEQVIGWFINPTEITKTRESKDSEIDIIGKSSFNPNDLLYFDSIRLVIKMAFREEAMRTAQNITDVFPPDNGDISSDDYDENGGIFDGGTGETPGDPRSKLIEIIKTGGDSIPGEKQIPGKELNSEEYEIKNLKKLLKKIDSIKIAEYLDDFVAYQKYVQGFLNKVEINKKQLDNEAIAWVRLNIAENLISLVMDDEHVKNAMAFFSYYVLANKYDIDVDDNMQLQLDAKARKVLFKFENVKSEEFRENITSIFKSIAEKRNFCDADIAAEYLDDLFGYIPLDRIKTKMETEFSSEVDCCMSESESREFSIIVTTKDIGKYLNIYFESDTVSNLVDYNKAHNVWDKICFIVCLKDDQIDQRPDRDPLVSVKRIYDANMKDCVYYEKYREGDYIRKKQISRI